jgi:hypothetical protein
MRFYLALSRSSFFARDASTVTEAIGAQGRNKLELRESDYSRAALEDPTNLASAAPGGPERRSCV